MKKTFGADRKLKLHRETLRVLGELELKPIAAGDVTPATSQAHCPPPEIIQPPH